MKKRGLKSVSEHEATLNDGTKVLDYSNDLIDLYYRAVYDSLANRQTDNYLKPFVNKSIKSMIDEGRDDLGIKSLEALANLTKETTAYFSSKQESNSDFIEYKIDRALFPWQKPMITNDSKRNTLLCGRRAGKSFAEAALAVHHCSKGYDTFNGFKKKRTVLVMGLTSERAKDVFWDNILKFIDIAGLEAKPDSGKLVVYFANGAEIYVRGNNSKVDREKLRGADYSMIIIDECQSQQSLEYLMTDILGPIIRGRDSVVYLSGTGALTNKGYWKNVTTGDLSKEWRHFTATMKDNPTIPEGAMEEVLRENGWTEDNITFRREYLAENVIDLTRIVYPVYHKYDSLPRVINRIAIGIDYGWNDKNALVPLGLGGDHKIYELHGTQVFNKASASEVVAKVVKLYNDLLEEYKVDKNNIICIADDNDQTLSAEIQKQCRIQNAYKKDRIQQIFDLRAALERSDVMICSDLMADGFEQYIWKYDDENKCVVYETDDDISHPDQLASLRYSYWYLKSR